jgi:pimeloyl-ACP methyl ester carboxylesterase
LRRLAGLRARSIDVQRQTFPYLAGGTGEPLVLVHGFTGDKDMWGVVASYAAKYP